MWSDARMANREPVGTTIGMSNIKQRRLNELHLTCHPDLRVGQCVPFYFCPRSVMLFLIHRKNVDLVYKGGQEMIVHLEGDLMEAIAWATQKSLRWAFTLSNAGAYYCESRSGIADLCEVDWGAVHARTWSGAGVPQAVKEGKQAEFLVEERFPWHLVERVGVYSSRLMPELIRGMACSAYRPRVEVKTEWYY